jgi:hypothetical protein
MTKWLIVAAAALTLILFVSCRRTPTEPSLIHERAQGPCGVGSCK